MAKKREKKYENKIAIRPDLEWGDLVSISLKTSHAKPAKKEKKK